MVKIVKSLVIITSLFLIITSVVVNAQNLSEVNSNNEINITEALSR